MTTTVRKLSLKQILYNYRHTLIPALVFTIELKVWATLNLKGLGDKGWVYWRVFLLINVFLVFFSGYTFEKDDDLPLMFGSVIPFWRRGRKHFFAGTFHCCESHRQLIRIEHYPSLNTP